MTERKITYRELPADGAWQADCGEYHARGRTKAEAAERLLDYMRAIDVLEQPKRPPFAVIDTADGQTTVVMVIPADAWSRLQEGKALCFDANQLGMPVRILLGGAATHDDAMKAIDVLIADPAGLHRACYEFTEDSCPGHVGAPPDGKRCLRCGTHVDAMRPPDATVQ